MMKYKSPQCRANGMVLACKRYMCTNKSTMMKCTGELTKDEAESREAAALVLFVAASARTKSGASLKPVQEEFKATELGPVIRSPIAPPRSSHTC